MSGEDYSKSSLWTALPSMGFNLQSEIVEGSTSKGVLMIIFPNAEAMFSWYGGLMGKGLAKLAIFNLIKAKGLEGPGRIPSPVGMPNIPGFIRGSGKDR